MHIFTRFSLCSSDSLFLPNGKKFQGKGNLFFFFHVVFKGKIVLLFSYSSGPDTKSADIQGSTGRYTISEKAK